MLTVGLPNYCSPIAWLAMESLCRQETTHDWELFIYEDSDKPLGLKFYKQYGERLAEAGCKNVRYWYSKERVPLSEKWLFFGKHAHRDSLGLMLQASDCYSEPKRIQTAVDALALGYNWIQSNEGCFYHIDTGQLMLYRNNGGTGLNMTIGIKELRAIPREAKWSGVDFWLASNIIEPVVFIDESDNWQDGVDTDGFSRISLTRKKQYKNPQPPFYKCAFEIQDLVPQGIAIALKATTSS